MIQSIFMCQQLILARDIGSSHLLGNTDACTLYTFASVLERSSNQPAFLVLINLMYTNLMTFATVLETSVVNQIGTSVLSSNYTVMSLSTLAKVTRYLIAPFVVCAKDVNATVSIILTSTEVEQVSIKNSTASLTVDIGTIGIL